MSINKADLYKVVSEEFEQSEKVPKSRDSNSLLRVGKVPTSKPDLNLVLTEIKRKYGTQAKVALLAGVRKEVVKDFLHGRIYKKSPAQEKLILWFFNNGFEECFPKKEKNHICICPHCGAKHRAAKPFKKRGGN